MLPTLHRQQPATTPQEQIQGCLCDESIDVSIMNYNRTLEGSQDMEIQCPLGIIMELYLIP